ncbi:hypothetical protein B0H14DRAFT_2562404 [Mycena olivaceomarginata]|nr:hypothetical protein B0H14DRAFT_2562404 [Mycena olivaceomarginata]
MNAMKESLHQIQQRKWNGTAATLAVWEHLGENMAKRNRLSESLSAAYEADRGRNEQARSAHEKLKTKADRTNSTEKHIVDIVYRPIYLWGHEKYMTTYRDNMISELDRVGKVEPKPFTDVITKMAKFVVYPDRTCRLSISAGSQEPAVVAFGNICRTTEDSFILKDAGGILWNTRMIAFWDSQSTGEHWQFQVEGIEQPYTWPGLLRAWNSRHTDRLFEVNTQMRQRNPPTNIGNFSQWFSKTFSPGVHESQVKDALAAESIGDVVRYLEASLPHLVRVKLNHQDNFLKKADIVFKFLSAPEATADHITCFREALAKVGGPGIKGLLLDIESQKKESEQDPRGPLGPTTVLSKPPVKPETPVEVKTTHEEHTPPLTPHVTAQREPTQSQNEHIASRPVPPAAPVLRQAGGSGIIRDSKASHSEPKAPEKACGHDDSPVLTHRGTARSESVHEIAGPLLKTPAVPKCLEPVPGGSEKLPEKAPRESGLPRKSQPAPSTQIETSMSTAVSEGAISTPLAAEPKKLPAVETNTYYEGRASTIQQGQNVATQPKTTPTQVQGKLVASKQGPPAPAPVKSEWWLKKWAKKAAGYVGLT